jgi:Dolichyl-phosphate-mannose-protein mannosyltransferase
VPSRLLRYAPPVVSVLATLVIFAFSLGTYCLRYFPYEDDFALIRYSAAQNSPSPITWITQGFTKYFANDPNRATNSFGFVRPVENLTYYLESLLHPSAQGPLLLLTNVLCWLISGCLLYGIARRLGASRWIAASGILLYLMSPCWYRGLIHSSFRTNGVATCFILVATYVLLDEHAVRSWARLWFAGGLVALAAGSHEQALTSLPVFALGIAWLSLKTEGETWRRTILRIAAFVVPSLLLVSCFHITNPMYGTSYATAGLLGELSKSDRLASLGIHSPLLIGIIKFPIRVFSTIIGTLGAFTPLGTENMAKLSPHIGVIIFALAGAASLATLKQYPRQKLAVVAFLLFALGRNFGMRTADARFTQMECAWGVIALVCALSAGFASRNKIAITTGALAAIGLLAFDLYSYNATIVQRHSILISRDEVDRDAFHRMSSTAAKFPDAKVVLSNDQAGMWAARAMLELAGFKNEDFEILPTINNYPSADVLPDWLACPVTTQTSRLPTSLEVSLFYPSLCSVSTFGRDNACAAKHYGIEGQPYASAWSACLANTFNRGPCPQLIVDDVPIQADRPLVLIAWSNRLSIPDIRILSNKADRP